MMRRRFALALALLLAGCTATPPAAAAAGAHDEPVPAGEPRAELALVLDLRAASDCEERFDLALYRERGVEVVAWDGRHASCRARAVTIRYLPQRISAEKLRARVTELAVSAKDVVKEPSP